MREQDNSASLQLVSGPKMGYMGLRAAGSVLHSLPHLCKGEFKLLPNRRLREIQIRFKPQSRRTDGRREGGRAWREQGSGKSLLLFVPPLSPASGGEGGTNQADTFPDEGEKQGNWELTRCGRMGRKQLLVTVS